MMKSPLFGSALALVALTSAQTAQAQDVCVEAEDVGDAIVYMAPLAYEATRKTCLNELASDSFLYNAQGKAFAEKFRAQQDARWPGTIRFFRVFIQREAKGQDAMGEVIANLPDDALRPLIDGIMEPVISQEIKPDSCTKINRITELLSPLPPENVGSLITFLLPEIDLKDPPICGVIAKDVRPIAPPPPIMINPRDEVPEE